MKATIMPSDLRTYAMDSRHAGRIAADRDCALAECERAVPRQRLMAQDSAANVFRSALNEIGVPHLDLDDAALPAMFRVSSRLGSTNSAGTPTRHSMAMDSGTHADFDARFPAVAAVRSLG